VEIADDWDIDSEVSEALDDVRNRLGRRLIVDRDADELGSGSGEGSDLSNRTWDVGGIGVGHGLHHDRMVRADRDVADQSRYRFSAWSEGHG
jgi:hypothetical protein